MNIISNKWRTFAGLSYKLRNSTTKCHLHIVHTNIFLHGGFGIYYYYIISLNTFLCLNGVESRNGCRFCANVSRRLLKKAFIKYFVLLKIKSKMIVYFFGHHSSISQISIYSKMGSFERVSS